MPAVPASATEPLHWSCFHVREDIKRLDFQYCQKETYSRSIGHKITAGSKINLISRFLTEQMHGPFWSYIIHCNISLSINFNEYIFDVVSTKICCRIVPSCDLFLLQIQVEFYDSLDFVKIIPINLVQYLVISFFKIQFDTKQLVEQQCQINREEQYWNASDI